MQQTLFSIDHALFENQWLLLGWIVLSVLFMGYQLIFGSRREAFQFIPIFVVIAAIIYFVLPRVETLGVNPDDPNGPLVASGLAIRGYGFLLLVATVAGFGLSLYRCRQVGMDGDQILSLCFWMVVIGILGARLFYVIQKFDSFASFSPREMMFKLLDMTSGGLVVYGSLIGGVLAAAVYMRLKQMPWRRVIDVLAPGMILGLAIGRIGCLMNGCCYGGVCDANAPGLYFPAGSAPYWEQLVSGQMLGIEGEINDRDYFNITVTEVAKESLADRYGVEVDDQIRIFPYHRQEDDIQLRLRAAKTGSEMDLNVVVESEDGPARIIPVSELPTHSLKTHPTQIYSSINAGLLCLLLWFYFPYRRSDGEVFAIMLILYPVGRFLLEIIRRDEHGQFGTSLTISQWVSIGILCAGIGLFAYVRQRPQKWQESL